VKHALEDAGFVEAETMLDGDDLIDLGTVSKETRGGAGRWFEAPDCDPGWTVCP
jgi:hypothetical protein